jgi:hypothetical protein
MPSVTHTHSHLHALLCNGRWPCSCADDAQLCSHTLTPLMTSMTSPLALARDETVAVINCDAHVDTTNHTPTTTRPSPGQQSGPPAFRGTSVVFAFALFHPSNAFCGTVPGRSNKTTSSCPKQASRAEHYRPSGICPVVPASAQLPDTITLPSRTISPFFADRASFQRAQTPALAFIQTLVTKKPIVTIIHICSAERPHLADCIQTPYWPHSGMPNNTDFEARPRAHLENETSTTVHSYAFAQARPFHRFHSPARSPPPCSDPRTFAHSLVSLAAYFGRVCINPPRKAEKQPGTSPHMMHPRLLSIFKTLL